MQNAKERTGKMREEKQAIIRIEHLNKQYIVDKKPVDVLRIYRLKSRKASLLRLWDTAAAEKAHCFVLYRGWQNMRTALWSATDIRWKDRARSAAWHSGRQSQEGLSTIRRFFYWMNRSERWMP